MGQLPGLGLTAMLTASLGLGGCMIVPTDGPLEREVLGNADVIAATDVEFTYGLVDLDTISVTALDDFDFSPMRSTFGLGSAAAGIRIGVGDVLNVTIFEAGPDGLFSTTERKQVALPLTVQGSGLISVPYAGTVQAAGRTAEQVRASILAVLRERAVEPDIIVNLDQSVSRSVSVLGAVQQGASVPLVAGDERVLDVVARAGGPTAPPYQTFVTLLRGKRSATILLQELVDRPHENIFVRPGDTVFLSDDPRTVAAFGAVELKGNLELSSAEVSLAEAAAEAQGLDATRANPQGYFVFRYEREAIVRDLASKLLIDEEQLAALLSDHTSRDKHGRIPIVYRVDLSDPDGYFVAKRFAMRDKDVIYVARSFGADLREFVDLVGSSAITAAAVANIDGE